VNKIKFKQIAVTFHPLEIAMHRRILAALFLLLIAMPVFAVSAQTTITTSVPASDDEIAAYVAPIERLYANDGLLSRRDFRQVIGEARIYDAPEGRLIETRPQGEYFVSVNVVRDGWAEINDGQWVRLNQLQTAPISRLAGVVLNGTMAYPVGWLREITFTSTMPGVLPQATQENALDRYTLVNVFAEQEIAGINWVQIGINQWVQAADVAIVNPITPPAGVDTQRWVGVDLAAQVITAYEGSEPVFAALVATGLDETPTLAGLYHVYARFHARDMSRGDVGEPFFYWMEDVPYTLYFNGNLALHGAYWHDDFGGVRSHGCVNMSLTDAYWIFEFLSAEIDFNNPDDVWPVVVVY